MPISFTRLIHKTKRDWNLINADNLNCDCEQA